MKNLPKKEIIEVIPLRWKEIGVKFPAIFKISREGLYFRG